MKSRISLQAALLCLVPCIALAQILDGKVTRVKDGDSFSMKVGKSTIQVRLYGIDCPEYDQPHGARAKAFTKKLCEGKDVRLHITGVDTTRRKILAKDKRIVGVVTLPDKRNLNHLLVENGLAWWYTKHAPEDTMLSSLQEKARSGKIGLWRNKKPIAPWKFRYDKRKRAEQKRM